MLINGKQNISLLVFLHIITKIMIGRFLREGFRNNFTLDQKTDIFEG